MLKLKVIVLLVVLVVIGVFGAGWKWNRKKVGPDATQTYQFAGWTWGTSEAASD